MEGQRELLPGVVVQPQSIKTVRGLVEFDLTERGKPVVLSVHGGIGGCDQARVMVTWLDLLKYTLLCPSRPGYLGTPLESGRTMEEQADLLAALLDALGIDRVAVVAASAGGPPGYLFAIRHPDRVWGLVAIDAVSGFYDLPETAGPIAQAIFLSDIGQKLLRIISEKKPQVFLKEIFQSEGYFSKKQLQEHLEFALNSPEMLGFVRAFMIAMNPYKPRRPGTENDMEQFRQITHLPVEQIQCPSLIIHGTHDADVKFYDGVYAYEHIPKAERFWIEEGSHLGFWLSRTAAQAQEAARDFLGRHAPQNPVV